MLKQVFEPAFCVTGIGKKSCQFCIEKHVLILSSFHVPFMEYKCPCGKMHKSRNTVSRHKKALAQKAVLGNVPKDVPKDKKGQEKDTQGRSFLKEINLQGEFNKMAETINPKKDEPKEPKYKCGSCGQTFNDKYKRCPHCGVEFE